MAQNNNINMVDEKDSKLWKNISIVLGMVIVILLVIGYGLVFVKLSPTLNQQVIIGLGFIGVFAGIAILGIVKKTVGINFVLKLFKLNKLKKKGYILFKICTLSKRPEYQLKKDAPIIHYNFNENGIVKNKLTISDQYAKYNDFGGDYTILEANPNEILPINRFTGMRIGMTPEIIDKFVIDSSKSAEEIDTLKKQRKLILYILGGLAVLTLFGFDLYSQRLAAAQTQVTEMARLCGTKGSIVAGGFVRSLWGKKK